VESISLGSLRTAVVNEASIDGQTGTNGRHSPANLNALINRYCREVRGIAADAGAPWFQVVDTITPIPAAVSNEDFIEIPFPTAAIEILGVDVTWNQNSCVKWGALDRADWSQRRLLNFADNRPEGGLGWWCVEHMPEARDSASITAGTIALFPAKLSGSYRVTYREAFTDMTDDTHLFVGIVPMFTWVINSCLLAIIKRDNNKKANYAAAQAAVEKAEARILKASKRTQSGGAVVPKRVGGEPW
jgi:hypothetical protein